MDDLDIAICKALLRDARAPYRALAKRTGLSTVAVHKRVQDLMAQGVIKGFEAEIDIRAFRGVSIMVFGRSEVSSPSALCQALTKNDSTSMILQGSGNFVYVGAMLRSISDLEPYLQFVRTEGKMPQAVAGIHTMRPSGLRMADIPDPGEITPLEMRIIASLRHDARKRTTEIGKELGCSSRMVSSKLSAMIKASKINLTIRWRPDYSNDTVALLHLTLRAGSNKAEAINLLHDKYDRNVVFLSNFGNMPETILATTWTRSPVELSGLIDDLMGERYFEATVPNIIYGGYFFDTWKEKLLDQVVLRAPR